MDYFPVYYIYCRFNLHIHDLIHLWLVPNQEAFGLFGPWDGCRARLPLQRTCHLTSGRARTLQAAVRDCRQEISPILGLQIRDIIEYSDNNM
jgi:hypothetical protein